jgi:hypothetical protein
LREIPDLYADLLARDDVLRSSGGFGWVSGTHEAPVPARLDAVDLTMPARRGAIVDADHDQVGHLPVAAILDSWADDWRMHRRRGEGPPEPVVPALCRWLGDRVEDACDDHPAIGDFADELRGIRSVLYGVLGLNDVPDVKHGVPCRSCDALALVQYAPSEYMATNWVECTACGLLLNDEEYAIWVALVSAHVKGDAA